MINRENIESNTPEIQRARDRDLELTKEIVVAEEDLRRARQTGNAKTIKEKQEYLNNLLEERNKAAASHSYWKHREPLRGEDLTR